MRMKHIYHLLKKHYTVLEGFSLANDPYKIGNSSNNRGKVSNWKSVRVALKEISQIAIFKDFCVMVLEDPFFATEKDSFYIPFETYQTIYNKYRNFMVEIETIINFFDSLDFSVNENGFDVKMPPTDNLDDFANNIGLLNKAINQCPYLNIENERIVLKKTDIGSIWFEFLIVATGSSIVLANLAKLVDKCLKIKSHYTTLKQQEELYRKAELENEQLAMLIDCNKKVMNTITEDCIKELKEDIPEIELDGDSNERVRYTLDTFCKLMDKGMEIYASIDAPTEIKDLFPTSDDMLFLTDSKKLLEERDKQ